MKKKNLELLPFTKADLWDELEEKCPREMKAFKAWIDAYKKRVDWLNLFNSSSEYQNVYAKNALAPKYHDLPAAMQIGIFLQYTMQVNHSQRFLISPSNIYEFRHAIRTWFMTEEYYNTIRSEDIDNFGLN